MSQLLVYFGSSTGLAPTRSQRLDFAHGTVGDGAAVACSVGDWDGDGFADLAIASISRPDGAVYVYFGSPAGLETRPALTLSSPEHSQSIDSLAGPEDFDGDGFGDLLVHGFSDDATVPSYTFVAYGGDRSPHPLGPVPAIPAGVATSTAPFAFVGDVTGDGYGDALIPTGEDPPAIDALTLFRGRPGGFVAGEALATPDVGGDPNPQLHIQGVGDLDGDGVQDALLIREPTDLDLHATLYRGGETPTIGATLRGDGTSIGVPPWTRESLGDLNGDGFDDLVIGVDRTLPGSPLIEVVFLGYSGADGRLPSSPSQVLVVSAGVSFAAQYR